MCLILIFYSAIVYKIFADYFLDFPKTFLRNIKIVLISAIIFSLFIGINKPQKFYILTEISVLILIAIEDELNYEIDFLVLIWLLMIFILKYIFLNTVLNFKVLIFANIIYILIYFASKKSIGIGDLFLNSILSSNFGSIRGYYFNFVVTFFLGMIYSLILLKNGGNIKTEVPFVKFMVFGYLFVMYGGIYV